MATAYDTWKLDSGEPEDEGFEEWYESLSSDEMWYFAESWMVQTKSMYGLVQRLDGKEEDQFARIRADLEQTFCAWMHDHYIKNVLPTIGDDVDADDYIDDYYQGRDMD